MKSQSLLLLVVAAGCGLVAMFGVQKMMSKNSGPVEETVEVLQASVEIQPGDLLDETNTKLIRVNVNACPEGVVTDPKMIVERSIKVPAVPGDWILVSKLSEKGEVGAATNVPDGMRALAIPVDATQTLSGMLRPGNRVDIMLTYEARGLGNRRQVTRTLLQYVEIFAVDDRIYGNNKTGEASAGAKNISVLVTPEQAGLLRLAEKMGTLSTSLRSNSDRAEVPLVAVTDEELSKSFNGSNAEAPGVLDEREAEAGATGDIVAFEDNPPVPNPIVEQLQAEVNRSVEIPESVDPGGSTPVIAMPEPPAPKNLWTIEIREGAAVRLETVELPDQEEMLKDSESESKGTFWDFLQRKKG